MISPEQLVAKVAAGEESVELHWLEWKTDVDLRQREWQARAAKFILATANRPLAIAESAQRGHAFMLLGIEPGAVVGTPEIDPAEVNSGLTRYLGTAGPGYVLSYVPVEGLSVAVLTVSPTLSGQRPYLARGTLDGPKKSIIQDGRIYVRRGASTVEATAVEVDEMLSERVGARIAAGPRWPLQPVEAWRDGRTIHIQQERGDRVVVHGEDRYANLIEMARERLELPAQVPTEIEDRVRAMFGPLRRLVDEDPVHAVEDAWPLLRLLTLEVHHGRLACEPPSKVIDMVTQLVVAGHLEAGWVDVAYPLYYWPIEQEHQQLPITHGSARTYVSLVVSLATALLLAAENHHSD